MTTLQISDVEFKVESDGAFLRVNPNPNNRVDFALIKDELLKRRVKNANFARIREVISDKNEKFTWVGDPFEYYEPVKDKYIDVRVSEDRLSAFLSVRFPQEDGLEISENDIRYKVWQARINLPLEEKKIEEIARNKKPVGRELICSGKAQVNGKDGEILFKIDVNNNGTPLLNDDGSVDYRRLNLVKCVEKDQHLAELIPAGDGEPGVDVYGEPIPQRPGKHIKLPRGLNTYMSSDEGNLFARNRGHVYLRDGLLNIEPVYVVAKDVDFSTGNIEFNGEVVIKGDVKSGFRVETDGNILIRGSVESAEVSSISGEIVVNGGIFGKYKAKLQAKHDIKAEFAQHAHLIAGNEIKINKYILDCRVEANGYVDVAKGQIIGGEVISKRGVVSREIGSPKIVKTRISVGKSIDADAWMEALQIEKKLKDIKKEYDFLVERIMFLEVLEKRLKKLTDQKQAELAGYLQRKDQIRSGLDRLEAQKKALSESSGGIFNEMPFIRANFKIYPGVTIEMNNYNEEIKEKVNAIKFILKPDGVEKKALI